MSHEPTDTIGDQRSAAGWQHLPAVDTAPPLPAVHRDDGQLRRYWWLQLAGLTLLVGAGLIFA
jgi:hypothetical protein